MLGLADGHNDPWLSIEANILRGQPLDWSFLLEHYSSTLDLPSAAFYKQLLKANPHAKGILTVRDPAAIHRSAQGTWCRLIGVGSVIDWLVSRPHTQIGRLILATGDTCSLLATVCQRRLRDRMLRGLERRGACYSDLSQPGWLLA